MSFEARRLEIYKEKERRQKEEVMAKQIIHIGLAVSTDGFRPAKANVINLAAAVGNLGTFNVNILPKNGVYGNSPFWSRHQEEFEKLKVGAEPLGDAMTKFRGWLKQWQGNLVACTSSLDFWHLFEAMMETGKDCPFGSVPMDTNSYYAGVEGTKAPKKLQGSVVPLEVAKERWKIVTQGKLPVFGKKPVEPPTPRNTIRMGGLTRSAVEALQQASQGQGRTPRTGYRFVTAPSLYDTLRPGTIVTGPPSGELVNAVYPPSNREDNF